MRNRRDTGRCITVHKNRKSRRKTNASLAPQRAAHTDQDPSGDDARQAADLETVAQKRLLELLERQGVELKAETRKTYLATRRLLVRELQKQTGTRWVSVTEEGGGWRKLPSSASTSSWSI